MAAYIEEKMDVEPNRKRIHWGAVFAGMVVVLAVQLTLGLLGIGFGAGAIDPLSEKNPLEGLGIGSAVWTLSTLVLSLFAGGWVAGRLGGVHDHTDSTLHGVVTWGLASIVSFYLVTTTVGSILSGATGMVGRIVTAAGQGVSSAAPEVARVVGQQVGIEKLDLSSIKEEGKKLLAQTGKPELQPRTLERQAQSVGKSAEGSAERVAKNPNQADDELDVLIDRVFAKGENVVQAADREAVVNVLLARTSMSRPEAERTVDNWQKLANDAKAKFKEVAQKAEQKARETADATARGVSKAAVWTFVGLMVGLLAAALGGWLGSPKRRVFVRSSKLYSSAA